MLSNSPVQYSLSAVSMMAAVRNSILTVNRSVRDNTIPSPESNQTMYRSECLLSLEARCTALSGTPYSRGSLTCPKPRCNADGFLPTTRLDEYSQAHVLKLSKVPLFLHHQRSTVPT